MFNFSTWFTGLVIIYPVLNSYASPVAQVTLSEFLMFVCWGLFVVAHPKKIRVEWCLVPFCIYLFAYIIVPFTGAIFSSYSIVDWVGTAARLLFLYVSVSVLGKNLFNLEKGIKFIRWVAIGLAVYACIQMLMAKFGVFLSTSLPLPVMIDDDIDTIIANRSLIEGYAFRASSLFREPAHLSTYLIAALGVELCAHANKRRYGWALLFSLVTVLTLSSTGILVTGFIWGLYLFCLRQVSIKQFSVGAIIGSLILLGVSVVGYCLRVWQYFLNRTFHGSLAGIAHSTRFNDIQAMFLSSHSVLGVLFGQGLSQVDSYLPGFARAYLYLGIIGIVFIAFFLVQLYRQGNYLQRNLLLIFVVLNMFQ